MTKKILYADDEPWFVGALVDALRDDGYIVDQAFNGTEVVEKLSNKELLPDLIVLDIIMPTGEQIEETDGGRRTGLKVHEKIRRQLGLTIPIVFLTVVDDPGVEREIINLEKLLGVNAYALLIKPVLPTELLEKVKSLLGS